MFYYKTKFGSKEAQAAKAAGAIWNKNLKMWESPTEVVGLTPAKPSHTLVESLRMANYKNAWVAARFVAFAKEAYAKDPEKLCSVTAQLKDSMDATKFEDQCCILAIEKYLTAVETGKSTACFWTNENF
jgi:hypothetical protein